MKIITKKNRTNIIDIIIIINLIKFQNYKDISMKFNISYPLTGAQKTIDIDDDKR